MPLYPKSETETGAGTGAGMELAEALAARGDRQSLLLRPAKRRGARESLQQTADAAAALLEEGDKAHAGISSDARDLLLDEIEPDALQPRRHFDEAELRVLADDIARRGVLQPILVRPPLEAGGRYRLVAGERRWRAAGMAGKVRIPARVRVLNDQEARGAQLVENVMRAALSDIEKGQALRSLYELRKEENRKTTWEDVAEEVGLARSRINELFQLAQLPEPIANLIASGRLSGSHGIALQRAAEELDAAAALELAYEAARSDTRRSGSYGLSVAQLRRRLQLRLSPSTDLLSEEGKSGENNGENQAQEIPPVSAGETPEKMPERFRRPEIQRLVEALERNEIEVTDMKELLLLLQVRLASAEK